MKSEEKEGTLIHRRRLEEQCEEEEAMSSLSAPNSRSKWKLLKRTKKQLKRTRARMIPKLLCNSILSSSDSEFDLNLATSTAILHTREQSPLPSFSGIWEQSPLLATIVSDSAHSIQLLVSTILHTRDAAAMKSLLFGMWVAWTVRNTQLFLGGMWLLL